MKKTLGIITVAFLGLTACKEKDQAYYFANIDEAKSKIQQCKQQMKEAFKAKDEKAVKELTSENSECSVADRALKEHRKQEYEREIQERKAKELAEIEAIRTKLQAEYANKNWQEVTKAVANSECVSLFGFSKKTECQALEAVYNEKTSSVVTELKSQNLEELLAQRQTYCKQDQRPYSACSIWEKATTEVAKTAFANVQYVDLVAQEEVYCEKDDYMKTRQPCKTWEETIKAKNQEQINQFVQDYEKLKAAYNQCVDQVAGVGFDKRYKITSAYPCSQAQNARMRLKLPFDDFKNKME